MGDSFSPEVVGACLDEVLRARRSIRTFGPETPPREMVEAILQAGMLAPYAALAGGGLAECRRFVVLSRGTEGMRRAEALMNAQVKVNARRFGFFAKVIPRLRRDGQGFAKRLQGFAERGFPAFQGAPCIVIAAERRGIPPAQKQSLAHAMENMWLKATSLGLGFHLFSAVQTMNTHREFMTLLGLPCGEFELDACAIGWPVDAPGPREVPPAGAVTRWLK